MFHNSTDLEEHWWSKDNCANSSGAIYPCQEVFFNKSQDVPLRMRDNRCFRSNLIDIRFQSAGKIDPHIFDDIPKNWTATCTNIDSGISYNLHNVSVKLNQSVDIQVWLQTPPLKVDGNDSTVSVQWTLGKGSCSDCVTWQPQTLIFNDTNFNKKQILKITRVMPTHESILQPTFIGGGYDMAPGNLFSYLFKNKKK